jgi:hypothetical protein
MRVASIAPKNTSGHRAGVPPYRGRRLKALRQAHEALGSYDTSAVRLADAMSDISLYRDT